VNPVAIRPIAGRDNPVWRPAMQQPGTGASLKPAKQGPTSNLSSAP
jgi:hypothetical protein